MNEMDRIPVKTERKCLFLKKHKFYCLTYWMSHIHRPSREHWTEQRKSESQHHFIEQCRYKNGANVSTLGNSHFSHFISKTVSFAAIPFGCGHRLFFSILCLFIQCNNRSFERNTRDCTAGTKKKLSLIFFPLSLSFSLFSFLLQRKVYSFNDYLQHDKHFCSHIHFIIIISLLALLFAWIIVSVRSLSLVQIKYGIN